MDKKIIYPVSTEWIQFDEGLSASLLTAFIFELRVHYGFKISGIKRPCRNIKKKISKLGIRAGQNCETHTGPKFETHKKQSVGHITTKCEAVENSCNGIICFMLHKYLNNSGLLSICGHPFCIQFLRMEAFRCMYLRVLILVQAGNISGIRY